jgi:Mg2+ and Co2+ transporter CorA
MSDSPQDQTKSKSLHKVYDQIVDSAAKTLTFIKDNTERTRAQVQDLFNATSEQLGERAEETRKGVKIRMAMLEMEHHLNRLYPQIGKLLCDMVEKNRATGQLDPDLQTKLELAAEYRQRLVQLRQELEAQQAPPAARP